MDSILISIIVPIFNTGPFLRRCLDSLLALEEENLEFILVNDGSTDDSESICKSYLEKDVRFSYFFKSNGGLSSARNHGMKYARGQYLAFLDSDDYLENNFSSVLVEAIRNHPVHIIGFNHFYEKRGKRTKICSPFPKNREIEKAESLEILKNATWNLCLFFVWNRIFDRKWLLENNIWFDETLLLAEDKSFNADAIAHATHQYFLDEFLINYVFYENSLSQARFKPRLLQKYEAQFRALLTIYQKNGLLEIEEFAHDIACNYLGHAFLMQMNNLSHSSESMVKGLAQMRNSPIYNFSFAHFKGHKRFSLFVSGLIWLFRVRLFRPLVLLFKFSKAIQ
ncbi:MAG TPA: glycosyltransferase family 2 protein [Catalimonadaceae bacterium]|nr:glycosyltransferase family 2 protein [Catalimonadaceae bacterium]